MAIALCQVMVRSIQLHWCNLAQKTATFKQVLDLADFIGAQDVISSGICYDYTLALLLLDRASNSLTCMRFSDTLLCEVSLQSVEMRFPRIQVFPDSSILVTDSRCAPTVDGHTSNAVVFNQYGAILRRFTLGDAIEDVQISDSGEIWVSYFDEGIFGDGLGTSGLNCFDAKGKLIWRYQAPVGFDDISDCYAINVAGSFVYACYYTDFPVVQIAPDKSVTGWANNLTGARAIAVSDLRVLLFGGYRDNTRCTVMTLGTHGGMLAPQSYPVASPEGIEKCKIMGRGACLHALVGTVWYRLSIDDFSKSASEI
ncbi:MAG: hypothetical protein QG625_2848 [Cyanobacteriota bacterium erpe_2018_sw_39hr_WHONDRS-SW48-000098_B_bin.30]|nr:hypothetical protein [Cyanobacteriota bacterium erpe_2018_sw_39hr_WHONDRS-SW48-000098_B_bin.30]